MTEETNSSPESLQHELDTQSDRLADKGHSLIAAAFFGGNRETEQLFHSKDNTRIGGKGMYPPNIVQLMSLERSPVTIASDALKRGTEIGKNHLTRASGIYKLITDELLPTIDPQADLHEQLVDRVVMRNIRTADFLLDPMVAQVWTALNPSEYLNFLEVIKNNSLPDCLTSDEEMDMLWEERVKPTKKTPSTLTEASVEHGQITHAVTSNIEIDVPNLASVRSQFAYEFIPDELKRDPTVHPYQTRVNPDASVEAAFQKIAQKFSPSINTDEVPPELP